MKSIYFADNSTDIVSALEDLKGYWKLWSFILLHKMKLPTLNGAIFTSNYKLISSDIYALMYKFQANQLLFRHDKKPERPPYPRGGFFVSATNWERVLTEYFNAGRIVALLEPFCSLCNSYNFNIFFHSYSNVIVEVVGPGFDASDLQRGDISPHEVYQLNIEDFGRKITGTTLIVVDNNEYSQSVLARRNKIIRRLIDVGDDIFDKHCNSYHEKNIALDNYLRKIGSLLLKSEKYKEIGLPYIVRLVRKIMKSGVIEDFYNGSGILFPLNFSASIVNPGNKLIFWDIVSPRLKYSVYGN